MANQSHEADQLASKIEELNALKDERIAALARDMENIRTNINSLTGGHSVDLREPIDFTSIIEWSSRRSGVKLFLGGDYRPNTVVRIEPSCLREREKPLTEILTIVIEPDNQLRERSISVRVGESVVLLAEKSEDWIAHTERDMGKEVQNGLDMILNSQGEGLVTALNRIDLAEDAVRFARQALYQEVKAIADRVLSHAGTRE